MTEAPSSTKAFRAKYGLSRSRLASLLDITEKTVIRWEKKKVYPAGILKLKIDLLDKLLSSNLRWLLSDDTKIKAAAYREPDSPAHLQTASAGPAGLGQPGKGYRLSRAEKPIIRRLGVNFWKLYAPGHADHGALLTGPPTAPPCGAVEYTFRSVEEDERWTLHEWQGGELVPTRQLQKGWNAKPDPDVVDLAGLEPEPAPAPKPNPDGGYDVEDDWEPPASG
jgi:DNA-binding XRE family transcriptional regulator